jgi:prolipoprotein diacylglyceryltransferase
MRFFIERLRIDPANHIFGLRVNEWVSAVMFVASVAFLVVDALVHRGELDGEPASDEAPSGRSTD